jgi:hypothetical protein
MSFVTDMADKNGVIMPDIKVTLGIFPGASLN